jgi:hypothetical protein
MRRRDQWSEWIRAVERESETAAFAFDWLREQLQRNPSSLAYRGLGRRDYVEVARNREATYFVRLFAPGFPGVRPGFPGVRPCGRFSVRVLHRFAEDKARHYPLRPGASASVR